MCLTRMLSIVLQITNPLEVYSELFFGEVHNDFYTRQTQLASDKWQDFYFQIQIMQVLTDTSPQLFNQDAAVY